MFLDLSEKGFRFEDVFIIYIGDDVTDEDAFMEINEELGDYLGVGFLVLSLFKVSVVKFSLCDLGEVLWFFIRFREFGDAGTIKTLF